MRIHLATLLSQSFENERLEEDKRRREQGFIGTPNPTKPDVWSVLTNSYVRSKKLQQSTLDKINTLIETRGEIHPDEWEAYAQIILRDVQDANVRQELLQRARGYIKC